MKPYTVKSARLKSGHNQPPYKTLDLTKDQAEFLLSNCETNIRAGLTFLNECKDRDTAKRLVKLTENFKAIRDLLVKS